MYEPPVDLPEATLEAGLRTHYGLDVTATTLLSLGQDTAAWVYRVLTATDVYFVKARRSVSNVPSLVVPRYLDTHIEGRTLTDPVAQELAPLWQQRRDVIHRLVARAEALGQQVAHRPLAHVLCHADIHTNNVLLDADGAVWIVDWDDTLLAPQERELMFVVGGGPH